jgi:hypothetical protein
MIDKRSSNFYLIINDIFDIKAILNPQAPTSAPTPQPTLQPTIKQPKPRPTRRPIAPKPNQNMLPIEPYVSPRTRKPSRNKLVGLEENGAGQKRLIHFTFVSAAYFIAYNYL